LALAVACVTVICACTFSRSHSAAALHLDLGQHALLDRVQIFWLNSMFSSCTLSMMIIGSSFATP